MYMTWEDKRSEAMKEQIIRSSCRCFMCDWERLLHSYVKSGTDVSDVLGQSTWFGHVWQPWVGSSLADEDSHANTQREHRQCLELVANKPSYVKLTNTGLNGRSVKDLIRREFNENQFGDKQTNTSNIFQLLFRYIYFKLLPLMCIKEKQRFGEWIELRIRREKDRKGDHLFR